MREMPILPVRLEVNRMQEDACLARGCMFIQAKSFPLFSSKGKIRREGICMQTRKAGKSHWLRSGRLREMDTRVPALGAESMCMLWPSMSSTRRVRYRPMPVDLRCVRPL